MGLKVKAFGKLVSKAQNFHFSEIEICLWQSACSLNCCWCKLPKTKFTFSLIKEKLSMMDLVKVPTYRSFTLTGKRVKGYNDSDIREDYLFSSFTWFEGFSILVSNSNDFKVTVMESLLINRDHPLLNHIKHSQSLEFFGDWGR